MLSNNDIIKLIISKSDKGGLIVDDNTAELLTILILFGWIPIMAIGKAIAGCIESRTCGKCTCKNCNKDD